MWKYLFVMLAAAVVPLRAQLQVKAEPDTILAGDQEAKIIVSTNKSTADFSCAARKGGGTFSEFKTVQTSAGAAGQVIFKSPFPGEVEIDILDNKYNKVGGVTVVVVAPEVTILEEKSLDKFDAGAKTMPLLVKVTDQHGRFVKTAKLVCKLSELVNKKSVATTSKVSEFVMRDDFYEAAITGLKDASYKLEVIDEGHLEAFDRADNRDNANPAAVIEGLNISIQ